jgi:hypothetical protein
VQASAPRDGGMPTIIAPHNASRSRTRMCLIRMNRPARCVCGCGWMLTFMGKGLSPRQMERQTRQDHGAIGRVGAAPKRVGSPPQMLDTALSIVTLVLGLCAILALALVPLLGRRDREAEDAAREYFDRHGRWPEERSG